jgi:hypothetical protein
MDPEAGKAAVSIKKEKRRLSYQPALFFLFSRGGRDLLFADAAGRRELTLVADRRLFFDL